jgi:hypothetical protein
MFVHLEHEQSQQYKDELYKMTSISISEKTAEDGHNRDQQNAPEQCESKGQRVKQRDEYECLE